MRLWPFEERGRAKRGAERVERRAKGKRDGPVGVSTIVKMAFVALALAGEARVGARGWVWVDEWCEGGRRGREGRPRS